jgi:heme a synthase
MLPPVTAPCPPGLRRFAVLTAMTTLGLVGVGGLVTSHGVGMAVPDWPNTYGYNMFFFPVSQWVGGIFYEHTHRLVASGVGLMTTILTIWLYGQSARLLMRWVGLTLILIGLGIWLAVPHRWSDGVVLGVTGFALLGGSFIWPRCEPAAKWLRSLGLAAFLAVVLQGVLGGLRVVLYKDAIGILHATLAQLFFVLACAIALFTSDWWQSKVAKARDQGPAVEDRASRKLRWLLAGTTALILVQLILGAAMRHQHAGLAIPDFPLAYGRLWPAMDPASVASYNQRRIEVLSVNPITALQIGLQMTHRIVALLILGAVAFCAWSARRALGGKNILTKMAVVWLGLILTQVLLGAATIWSGKAADIATAHVLAGALSLALGVIVSIISSNKQVLSHMANDPLPAAEALTEPRLDPHSATGMSSRTT